MRTNANVSGSLFKGLVIFCPCCARAERMKFLGPLMDVWKSEEIGKVYDEYGAKEGFESLAAIVCMCWNSAPSGFCGTWKGLNERV